MTDTPTVLGPEAVRHWFEQGLRSLLAVRRQVDVLNVFPVPDGDTGTNLVLTLTGAARAVAGLGPEAGLGELTAAAARGALVGARGNSGVILSQAMRGLARSTAGQSALDGPGLAAALAAAAQDARHAVERPVEGTVLTVATAAAEAASAVSEQSLGAVAEAATHAAAAALAETRSQLPVLAAREVVDAGAAGYVILLEALAAVIGGQGATSRAREGLASLWATPRPVPEGPACALGAGVLGDHDASATTAFEVMYVLHASTDAARELRRRLDVVGDSVAVVGGREGPGARGLWQVHVHTDDPAAALSEQADMEQVCIRSLSTPSSGVLACTRLPGLVASLATTGAGVVLYPDAPGVERGVVDVGTRDVLVLPCDADSAALAEALGPDALLPGARRVEVAPTRSELAVLTVAAELSGGPGQHEGSGAQPAAVAPAELADADSPEAGPRPGAARTAAAARTVVAMRESGCALPEVETVLGRTLHPQDELLTVVVGEAAAPGTLERHTLVARLQAALAAAAPQAELLVLDGGQSSPDLLLGVE